MTVRERKHALICQFCSEPFQGYRAGDKFCSRICSDKNRATLPKTIAYQKKWNRENLSKNFHKKRDYMLRYYYGINSETYEKILTEQNGGCAICGKTPEEEGRSLAVDHDHVTGEIFGVLCALCNKFLVGHIRTPELYQKAYVYLSKGTGYFVPDDKKKPKRRRRRKKSQ